MSTLHLAWSQAVTRLGSARVHGYEHSLQPALFTPPNPTSVYSTEMSGVRASP